jgi:hypothetical protein
VRTTCRSHAPSPEGPAITSPTAPADAYRMGVTDRAPWATVARTLGYRDGKSAQTIAREYATANGLHYPFTYRGPGRRTATPSAPVPTTRRSADTPSRQSDGDQPHSRAPRAVGG